MTAPVVYDAVVPPVPEETFDQPEPELTCHWYDSDPEPAVAATVKFAVAPALAVTLAG